jgi:hypothetical protein
VWSSSSIGRPGGSTSTGSSAPGHRRVGARRWAVHSWQRSLFTLLTVVGVWAVFHGLNEIFAAFALRQTAGRFERLID